MGYVEQKIDGIIINMIAEQNPEFLSIKLRCLCLKK